MNIFSENIALFTAPALKNSRNIFNELGIYVFSDSSESNFKEEIFSKATHLGLGEKFLAKGDEDNSGKYVKISSIGEIEYTGTFSIEVKEDRVTDITNISEKTLNKEIFKKAMQMFLEESRFSRNDETFSERTPANWRFIYCTSENIIKIEENILYPSKNLVSFPLNLGKNNTYIPAKEIIGTIKISKNAFLDVNEKILFVKNNQEELKKGEIAIGNNLKKVPLGDGNKELYANILQILEKNPDGFNARNFEEFAKVKNTDFPEKIKAFNRGSFANYLDFSLNITTSLYISKKYKE